MGFKRLKRLCSCIGYAKCLKFHGSGAGRGECDVTAWSSRQGKSMPPPDDRWAEDRDERLSVRQAILVWLAAVAAGWLLTVGVVYLASRLF